MEKNFLEKINEESTFSLEKEIKALEQKTFMLGQEKETLEIKIKEVFNSYTNETEREEKLRPIYNKLSLIDGEILRLTIDLKDLNNKKRASLN